MITRSLIAAQLGELGELGAGVDEGASPAFSTAALSSCLVRVLEPSVSIATNDIALYGPCEPPLG